METKERKPHLKRGLWKPEEDIILKNYVETHGEGNWADVSERSGLMRGGKSCRLRWKNYLRPNLKRGGMSEEEEDLIIRMHKLLGNRWSLIAGRLPGRTDNEVKNYWNTHLNKKCHLGKRRATESTNRSKDRDEDNNKKKKKQRLPLSSSQPICTAITQEDTPGLKEKNEVKKESSVSSTWMEDIRSFNYDPESPLLLPDNATFFFDDKPIESPLVLPYSAAFLFDDEPSFTCFDSFLLF